MKNIRYFVSGFLIGIANLIPGVSGGTMAVITGVYEKLISIMAEILKFKLKKKDFLLLCFVGIGMLISVFSFSSIMDYLLKEQRFLTYSFFLGIIIGSIPGIKREIERIRIFPLFVGLILVIIPSFLIYKGTTLKVSGDIDHIKIFISGFLGIGAMILPGFSGSLLLLIMGTYDETVHAINNIDIRFLSVFSVGLILGLISFVNIIKYMMKKYRIVTQNFILGLIIGSIYTINPFKYTSPNFKLNGKILILCITLVILGIIMILLFEKLAKTHTLKKDSRND